MIESDIQLHYAFYDPDTGIVLGVGPQPDEIYVHNVIIPYEAYQRISSGTDKTYDYYVGPTVNDLGESVPGLISKKVFEKTTTKYKMFSVINVGFDETEVTIHWREATEHWEVEFSDIAKNKIYNKEVPNDPITFFITLEEDFDFLIRYIVVVPSEVLTKSVFVPFESKFETQINKIAVSSTLALLSQSLKVWKKDE